MENTPEARATQLKERIEEEKRSYIRAIDEDHNPQETREIIRRINMLQKELNMLLLLQKKDNNNGSWFKNHLMSQKESSGTQALTQKTNGKSRRGFASMDKERHRLVSSKGGKSPRSEVRLENRQLPTSWN